MKVFTFKTTDHLLAQSRWFWTREYASFLTRNLAEHYKQENHFDICIMLLDILLPLLYILTVFTPKKAMLKPALKDVEYGRSTFFYNKKNIKIMELYKKMLA